MPENLQLSKPELFDRMVSELSEFALVLIDKNGKFASWHPGVQQHFLYTAEEFIGQGMEVLLPPTDRLAGVAERELQEAADTGRANDTRWLARKDGQRVLVEGVTIGLREGSTLLGFGKIMRDVTERQNAENSLSALTEALDQASVIVRRWDGTIEHWTAGCERLYGWSAEDAVGHVCHELLRTRFPAPLEQIQEQLRVSGAWRGDVEHIRRDGTRVLVASHWALLADRDDQPMSVIETETDITARFHMQRELEAANDRLKSMAEELERSNVELEEFARIASHDLSAPLISTRWLIDLLASRHSKQLDEEGRKCLQQITQSLDRMSDLVQGILAHAQVGTSAIGSSQPVDTAAALNAALENLRRDIETSQARIHFDPLPPVKVEFQALSQLFQNILSNAIKYRRDDPPPVIHISATREGPMWRIAVADNGIGIEPEWFERIFQPLQRRHGSEIAGCGIGLATCKKIVTRAGGRIWVESQLEEGSTFFFTLPAADD